MDDASKTETLYTCVSLSGFVAGMHTMQTNAIRYEIAADFGLGGFKFEALSRGNLWIQLSGIGDVTRLWGTKENHGSLFFRT